MGRRHRLSGILAALLLLGLALQFFRLRLRPAGAEASVSDGSIVSPSAVEMHRRQVPRGVPKRSAPVAQASADAGQGAVSEKAVRLLFEISAALHRNAIEAAQNVDRYCAETAKLTKPVATPPAVDPDAPGTQEHDAAYFFLPRVSWGTHPATVGTLELPTALDQRIRAAGDGWTTALTFADTVGLDFSWMSQLAQFDHWSLASVGPVAEQATTVDPLWWPIPYYLPLMEWAKLRMIQALTYGDAPDAVSEVQHLANLIASNGNTISALMAARMVWSEQQFENAAGGAGVTLPADLAPAFTDQVAYQQFHDLAFAGVAFMFPGVDPAVAKRALGCSPIPCAILSEQIALRREYDSFTDTEEDEHSFALANGSSCDGTLFELLETAPAPGVEGIAGQPGSELPLEKLFGPEVRARADAPVGTP